MREARPFQLVLVCLLAIGLAMGCTTSAVKQGDGTTVEVRDPPVVALDKRLTQAQSVIGILRGTFKQQAVDGTLTQEQLTHRLDFLDTAESALTTAQSGIRGAPCFTKVTCTPEEMAAANEAIGRALALIAKASS